MGYKLAGFDVLGGVEIDPEMMELYRLNHDPKYSYLMGVQEFKKIPNSQLQKELFNLDILDGSPPCSSFSMSGSREKAWGEKKKFREGQTDQVLDNLFFDFIDIAAKLKPKVVVAENVKGLVMGNARGYVKQIFKAFDAAGYDCQLFLLNASRMGVPQTRERTFFIATKKSLKLPKIKLEFNEPTISVAKALEGLPDQSKLGRLLTEETKALWMRVKPGDALSKAHAKGHRFNAFKIDPLKPSRTLAAGGDANPIHWNEPRRFSTLENARLQTFPDDYNFGKFKDNYVCGMSVPPFMMQRVATEIYKQLLTANEQLRRGGADSKHENKKTTIKKPRTIIKTRRSERRQTA
jgi:DNA (cytosine-5)-methyltransferase 1